MLAPLLVAVFMRAVPLTMIGPLLPGIARSLGAGLAEVSWIVAAYAAGSLIAQPLMGSFSDARGRRRVMLLCIGLFAAGSAICALSTSLWVLVVGRIIQALGAGGIQPVATAIIGDRFPEKERGGAIGALYGMFGVGTMVGALFGGAIVDGSLWLAEHANLASFLRAELTSFPWHVVFWVNVAIACVALWTSLALPQDMLSAGKTSVGTRIKAAGLDAELFNGNGPRLVYAVAFLFGVPSFSLTIFTATYFITRFGATPTQSGMALFALAVLYVVGAIAGGQTLRVWEPKTPLISGLALAAGALAALSIATSPIAVVIAMAAGGLGLGISSAPPNALVLQYFEKTRTGAATGLATMLATSGSLTAPAAVWAFLHFGRGDAAHNLRQEFLLGAVLAALCVALAIALPRGKTSYSFEQNAL